MSWLAHIRRDPVPWLLDPENPSARLLTLRHIFRRPEASLEADYDAVLAWKPVQTLLRYADLEMDADLVEIARDLAETMLTGYPELAERHLQRWLGSREELLRS